jgi:predicted TIM-barrel fold metal-dependent hydrolase
MSSRFSRRRVLATGGAFALGAGVAPTIREVQAALAEPQQQQAGHIDAHVHVWPKVTAEYPLDPKYTPADVVPESFTPEQIIKISDPEFVRRILLIQMSFFGFDNSYMLDCIQKRPKQFRGVAIIDHDAADVADKMVELKERGVRGFRLYANAQNVATWDANAGIDTMFKTAAKTRQAICLLSDPEVLPAIDAMATKYPNTRIVIDHFSRIGMRGSVDPKDLDNLCNLARHRRVFVKTSAFYALGEKKAPYKDLLPMIRKLRDAFTANRLMWGSDAPYQVQGIHSYPASVALISTQAEFLSELEIKAILGRTADELFFQD